MPVRLPLRDILALLIVLGAAVAGVVVWANGTVSIGMTLSSTARGVTVPARATSRPAETPTAPASGRACGSST